MKLRNKRTGDIWEFEEGFSMKASHETSERAGAMSGVLTCFADSLAELNEEWEDYKPTEPLIKDEKIRKAVRAWAEANNLSGASTYKSCSDSHYWYIRGFDDSERGLDIDIWGELPRELVDCKYYTIAELCGEEE